MATVVHPVFPDQKHIVTDADLESWTDQGWIEAEGDDALDEGSALTSFEQALLEQEKNGGQPAHEVSVGFQPTLVNDDIPKEL